MFGIVRVCLENAALEISPVLLRVVGMSQQRCDNPSRQR